MYVIFLILCKTSIASIIGGHIMAGACAPVDMRVSHDAVIKSFIFTTSGAPGLPYVEHVGSTDLLFLF